MDNETAFIGIDLAWRSDRNHTGAAVLRGDGHGARLERVSSGIRTLDAVREFIRDNTSGTTVVAIDAPLIIENEAGQRPCETAIGQRYGARDASCHTSNRGLYPDAASVKLKDDLIAQGYVHAPGAPDDARNLLLEVYPHAALVALFDLPKILKYKKGTLTQKRLGLQRLATHVRCLQAATPPLCMNSVLDQLLSRDTASMPGPILKMHEDTLDAVVCAYLAYYYWHWRAERNETFVGDGDIRSGYIINPKLLAGGVPRIPFDSEWTGVAGALTVRESAVAITAMTDDKPWCWEGNVVHAVVSHLTARGWTIDAVANTATSEPGVDIKATHEGQTLLVEAKGYPSTVYERGPKFGQPKPTSPTTQARHWVGEALLTALLRQSEDELTQVAMAFPKFDVYTRLLARIRQSIGQLGLMVLVVDDAGAVETVQDGSRIAQP
jgi:predicted RNase H-like nuclease